MTLLLLASLLLLQILPTVVLIAHVFFKYSSVYARRIDPQTIMLTGVAPEFAEALRVERAKHMDADQLLKTSEESP